MGLVPSTHPWKRPWRSRTNAFGKVRKLEAGDTEAIRERYLSGEDAEELAAEYGITLWYVTHILSLYPAIIR